MSFANQTVAAAAKNEITKRMLERDKLRRQAAVATFPLRVFGIAREMKSIIDQYQFFPQRIPQATHDYLDAVEKEIREAFIEDFGHDMVEESERTQERKG
jgi:hypothetical protein